MTHLAAVKLSSSVQDRVGAVVVFGDPDDNQGFPGVLDGRSITFCAQGDDICAGGDIVNGAHLSYGQVGGVWIRWLLHCSDGLRCAQDAGAAASFVVSHI